MLETVKAAAAYYATASQVPTTICAEQYLRATFLTNAAFTTRNFLQFIFKAGEFSLPKCTMPKQVMSIWLLQENARRVMQKQQCK